MNKPFYLLVLGLSLGTGAQAQSIGPAILNAAGNSAVIGGNTYEWSVGELVLTSTYNATELVVTQGLLQPVQTTGIHENLLLQHLQVYPSPVEQTLYLQPGFRQGGVLQYTLFDMGGKSILSHSVTLITGQEQQSMHVAALAAGQYMLQVQWVQQGKTYSNAYKIQKIQ